MRSKLAGLDSHARQTVRWHLVRRTGAIEASHRGRGQTMTTVYGGCSLRPLCPLRLTGIVT